MLRPLENSRTLTNFSSRLRSFCPVYLSISCPCLKRRNSGSHCFNQRKWSVYSSLLLFDFTSKLTYMYLTLTAKYPFAWGAASTSTFTNSYSKWVLDSFSKSLSACSHLFQTNLRKKDFRIHCLLLSFFSFTQMHIFAYRGFQLALK